MATAPPGLLNLNAAKISVDKGKKSALWFVAGVILTIAIQAVLAIQIFKVFISQSWGYSVDIKSSHQYIFSIVDLLLYQKEKDEKDKGQTQKQFF